MLTLNNISAGYGKQNIINNLSFSFESGKIYTILGKNGCGKSTLLKVCSDMLPLSSGHVFLHGKELSSYQPMERARNIGYLSQHRNTPNITVERLLMHGRHPHMSNLKKMRPEDWIKLNESMEEMEITAFRHKSLLSLSGGERQRVYISMMLTQDTPILLLDEPTTYMDIAYQLHFLELVKQLKKRGKTIIMVLHDLNQAMQYSDHILLMDQGHLAAFGSPQEIMASKQLQQVFQIGIQTISSNNTDYYHFHLL